MELEKVKKGTIVYYVENDVICSARFKLVSGEYVHVFVKEYCGNEPIISAKCLNRYKVFTSLTKLFKNLKIRINQGI